MRRCLWTAAFSAFVLAAPFGAATALSAQTVVVAAGDIACNYAAPPQNPECKQMETSDVVLALRPDAVLPLGDNQYHTGAYSDYLQYYDPSWGRVPAASVHPVPGNHEYLTPSAAGYFDYFNWAGVSVGDRDKGYYSFDLGAWHIIALNSNCSDVGGCGSGSPQEQWLRADLGANAQACTLAYWHHPRFTSGFYSPGDSAYQPFWQALYDFGAELVITGHDHIYERFAPQTPTGEPDPRGIRAFVVGTGGRSLYSLGPPVANSEVQNNQTFGVLQLTLHAGSYEWEFVPIAGQTFTDRGSAVCNE